MNVTKNLVRTFFVVALFSFFSLVNSVVFAQKPSSVPPVSFTPERALVGDQISLTALVKNTYGQRGVVTVDFFVGSEKIGTQAGEIEKDTERILMVPWVMPQKETVVTVKEVSFVGADGKKKNLTGVLGSVTVSPSSSRESFFSPYVRTVKTFLEKKRLSWLEQVEKKRAELKESAPALRDRIQDAVEIAQTGTLVEKQTGETKETLANQTAYYAYGMLRSVLASKTLFYVIIILFALALLKFIFGRFS